MFFKILTVISTIAICMIIFKSSCIKKKTKNKTCCVCNKVIKVLEFIDNIKYGIANSIIKIDNFLNAFWVFTVIIVLILWLMCKAVKLEFSFLEVFGLYIVYFIGDVSFKKNRSNSFITWVTIEVFSLSVFKFIYLYCSNLIENVDIYICSVTFFNYLIVFSIIFDMLRIIAVTLSSQALEKKKKEKKKYEDKKAKDEKIKVCN